MSKAFTREDDSGLDSKPEGGPAGPAWVSARAQAIARERLQDGALTDAERLRWEGLLRARVVPSQGGDAAAIGAQLKLKGPRDRKSVV